MNALDTFRPGCVYDPAMSGQPGASTTASIGPFRALPVAANRQPAAAIYVRAPGDTEYRLIAIDVLRIEEGGVAEIDTFDAARCPGFDLPATFPN